MRIKFIGTGSGKSSLKRFHSAFIISCGSFNLLVDAGDGVSRALLRQQISFNSIHGILISHLHPDHYSGLASLIVQMKMNKRDQPLKIFMHNSLAQHIEKFILQSYLFEEKLGFEIIFEKYNYDEFRNVQDNFSFMARENSHLKSNLSYAGNAGLSISCSSFLFNIDNKTLYYSGDIGDKEDLYLFNDFSINIMITEITHVNFDEVFEALKFLNPEKLFFTHISDENEADCRKLAENLPGQLKEKIITAADGMLIKV